jgi:hypothetical protein
VECILAATIGRRPDLALVLDIWAAQASCITPTFATCHITVFVIIWDFQFITATQITLLLTRSFDPRDVAAAAVGPTVVEEAGVRGQLGVAAGAEAFLKCTGCNPTETHENGFHLGALCTAVSLSGHEKHDRGRNCQRESNCSNSVSGIQ